MTETIIELGHTRSGLLDKLIEAGVPVWACYHCQRCTAGCPMLSFMDIPPNRAIRLLQFGREEEVLASQTIWMCASCQTCTTRCPNEVEIAHMMDLLRQEALSRDIACPESDVLKFHRAFLKEVKRGRVHELGMIGRFKFSTGRFFDDMKLGIKMFKRGRIKLLPTRVRGKKEVKRIFEKSEKGGPPWS